MSTAARTGVDPAGSPSGSVPGLAPDDPLLARLVDDAALFPPGNAPMATAVPTHADHLAAWYGALVGPYLCPTSRLGELGAVLEAGRSLDGRPLDLVLVHDAPAGELAQAVQSVQRHPLVELRGVEIAVRDPLDLVAATRRVVLALDDAGVLADLDDAPASGPGGGVYVELPRGTDVRPGLDVLAERELRAKLRTGGTEAAAHPDEAEVATFLLAALDREVALKCTAGLHHALRHTAPGTGFEQHGYLNLLAATATALSGGDHEAVRAVLAERDAAVVVQQVQGLGEPERARVRRWFRSYGSCSITEPVDDLVALGLLARG